jgi:hypothetical protein
MDVSGLVVGATLGASSKWFFDWVTALRGEAVGERRRVEDERLRFVASADDLDARLLGLGPSRADEAIREAVLEATSGISRLMAIGDIRGATRATTWLTCICMQKLGPGFHDMAAEAKADFLIHSREPVPRWSRHLKGPTDWRRNRDWFRRLRRRP